MKKFVAVLLLFGLLPFTSFAVEVDGVNLPDRYTINGKELLLNGYGYRKKFFVKVYIGGLYLDYKTSDIKEIEKMETKVIKMHFVYKEVTKDKLKETFLEGFEKNGYLDAKDRFAQFLDIFSFDVKANDVIDLILDKDKTTVKLNGSVLKELSIDGLSDGVLKIYLGENPADKGLKKAMLGQ